MEMKDLFDNGILKRGTVSHEILGGQSCGMPPRTVFVEFEPLGIRIEISGRSQLKSFELAIEILKPKIEEWYKKYYENHKID